MVRLTLCQPVSPTNELVWVKENNVPAPEIIQRKYSPSVGRMAWPSTPIPSWRMSATPPASMVHGLGSAGQKRSSRTSNQGRRWRVGLEFNAFEERSVLRGIDKENIRARS